MMKFQWIGGQNVVRGASEERGEMRHGSTGETTSKGFTCPPIHSSSNHWEQIVCQPSPSQSIIP